MRRLIFSSFSQICGVHGAYSKSCEIVMRVMRDNKESLMAVLEAFVYDPLFAWKLVATAPAEPPVATEGELTFFVFSRHLLTRYSLSQNSTRTEEPSEEETVVEPRRTSCSEVSPFPSPLSFCSLTAH